MKSIYLCLILISLCISSCDLFKTRDHEDPVGPSDNFQIATTPQELIKNLQNSLKDEVVENYMMCFSKNKFVFSPSAGSMLNYASLQNWDLRSEEQYFKNMINLVDKKSQIVLNLTDEELNRSADSVVYSASYLLSVPFISNQYPKSYKGILHFTMVQDSSLQWTIKRWHDIKQENLPEWSDLKGRMY